MSYIGPILPSPLMEAFSSIQWERDCCVLTRIEILALRSGENNPIDYTVSSLEDTLVYIQTLLKVLDDAVSPSGPLSDISNRLEPLSRTDAIHVLNIKSNTVLTHYTLSKLYEVTSCLMEKKRAHHVTIRKVFYRLDGTLIPEWRCFLRVLHWGEPFGDAYAQRIAAIILIQLFLSGCPSQTRYHKTQQMVSYDLMEEPIQALICWIISKLQSSSSESLPIVTPCLTLLVLSPECRILFAKNGGIEYIASHISNNSKREKKKKKRSLSNHVSIQQIYELCFCLWSITLECDQSPFVRCAFARGGFVIHSLLDLVATAPREKVVRLAIATLKNLACCSTKKGNIVTHENMNKDVDGVGFLRDMISSGFLKVAQFLLERQWSDPDLIHDLKILHTLLNQSYQEISRWDIYENEVTSGILKWGILHTEAFFKENVRKFEGINYDFSIVKVLLNIISTHTDDDSVSIACYDVGEFARFYPNGRVIMKRLGAKEIILPLINHESIEIQRHALQCISKMMIYRRVLTD